MLKKPAAKTAKAPVKAAVKAAAPAAKKPGFPAKKPGAKKPAAKKPVRKVITFKAPVDFKPAFVVLHFKTSADGLMSPQFRMERVRGKWDNPEAKRYDMMTYDAPTVTATMARLAGRLFAVNPDKRLSPSTTFAIVMRVNRKSADGTLSVLVKAAGKMVKSVKTGKNRMAWFADKKDPEYSKLRRCARMLPGAFTNFQLPPSGRQPKAAEE